MPFDVSEHPLHGAPTSPLMAKPTTANLTLSALIERLGAFQYTSKMPGPSWSIDASLCPTGQRLRATVPDSPCAKCYALKGHFATPKVIEASARRLQAYRQEPDWARLMARLIELSVPVGDPYFRWFSSGDLLDMTMLHRIIQVAWMTPAVQHWLPTQERDLVRSLTLPIPPNLTIRLSTPTINGVPSELFTASVVLSRTNKARWAKRVARNSTARHYCPSSLQDGQCGNCRTCWDPNTKVIAYLQH